MFRLNVNIMKYLIRSLKYIVYVVLIFLVIVLILYSFSPERAAGGGPFAMFKDGAGPSLIIFFVAVGALYPLLGFGKRKLYLNGDFAKYADIIDSSMAELGYEQVEKDETHLVYRQTSGAKRANRMWEDAITVNITDNPLVFEGFRKDLARIISTVGFRIRQSEDPEMKDNL